ncbi:phosphoribosylglycinamide formyltransferase [Sulfitobacter sp. TSTF-M16]|uniref:Phosphoribosylglycinamide formyltransferase n=1 Tax=Sulfitobacter aestuariivivens TaxID=2766981 RepID=A0A927HE00_9RHOB|nr:phosphoribosylglycinamide formyltransferase [Sulfitobacter aestuariivivens]MBD3663371.1 phosphoribosylglycinamide formyltransferase [Sulfitobacter aestuariivivens]
MTKGVAIFVSGGGSNMRALVADMVEDHPARPAVVLSNNADAGGIAWARAQGIPTEVVDHRPYGADRPAFEAALNAALAPHAPDIICLAGFMRILTAGFIDGWAGRMLNIHPSLLPKYKGLHTHARVLEAQDAQHGCTVHEVTAALDNGPMLGQAVLKVAPDDTPDSLAARVLTLEHRLYPAVLRRFAAGDRTPVLLHA